MGSVSLWCRTHGQPYVSCECIDAVLVVYVNYLEGPLVDADCSAWYEPVRPEPLPESVPRAALS